VPFLGQLGNRSPFTN